MKTRSINALLCATLLMGGATPALAGLDIDLGASVSIGNHTDLYFAISSRYFDEKPEVVERWGRHCPNPDDLAVALFLRKHSGHSLDSIFSLRGDGLSWWKISVKFGVPADVFFVPVKSKPGPPYGKAYGHWKKHKRNRQALLLSDAEVGHLVAVRMIHDYYSVPVETAMRWRSSGDDLRSLMSAEYERRHSRSPSAARYSPDKHSKHGNGKGR